MATPGLPTVPNPPGRPGLAPPATPKRRGKTADEYAAEVAAYRLAMRRHVAAIAAFERERHSRFGIRSYRWLACDVHGTCAVAGRYGGKVFDNDKPPPDGHVAEGKCQSPDWCRCVAVAVVEAFSELVLIARV